MFEDLSGPDRLQLLKFLCAFARLDLRVSDKERAFVLRLVKQLKLTDEEAAQVEQWLRVSPSPHSIVPTRVPKEHRATFIDALRAMVYVDGKVDPDARDAFDKLRAALED